MWYWGWLGMGISFLWGQAHLPYEALHQRLFPLVRDTTQRAWLPRLREVMEENRHIEWNDRFFREIVQLYLAQSDSLPVLLGTIGRYVHIDSATVATVFRPVEDITAEASALLTAFDLLYRQYQKDTSQVGYVVRQMSLLAQDAIQSWLPAGQVPFSLLVAAALQGYLKALAAGYAFFGFDASPEPWPQKMQVIEAIGLLEYYAYGESANAYRAWLRGLKR
ncbi:MAG: hypothetical protein N3A68_03565 [Bacteroidia bacterium]|nr:hypothetical protein [Bacteroidia bacterium]GIV24113.1 MAG: hypothetical protein KatS3mg025_1772 [Bacteroidia bacterium]